MICSTYLKARNAFTVELVFLPDCNCKIADCKMDSNKNVACITLPNPDEMKQGQKPMTPLVARRKFSMKERGDHTIPVSYQTVSAEVQNVIDKITTLDRQESVESRHRRVSECNHERNVDQQRVELVNELSVHRKQRSAFLRQAESNPQPVKNGILRQLSLPSPSADYLPQSNEKTKTFTDQAKNVIQKIIKTAQLEPPLNVLDEALESDHLISLELVEKKYETSRQHGLKENQVYLFHLDQSSRRL